MTDDGPTALIHGEIDGELDARQRAELARRMLADPGARASREALQRLCTALDAIVAVEPPAQLRARILEALPRSSSPSRRLAWPAPQWRYAAAIAGVLAAGTVVFETVDSAKPGSTEAAGTMAAPRAPATLDTVRLGSGPVAGRVTLYRDLGGLGVAFDLVADAPVDVLIVSDGHTLRVNGLSGKEGSGGPAAVALTGIGRGGQVDLTFLMSGREVGRATLKAPEDH